MRRQSLIFLGVLVLANFLLLWGQSAAAFWKWRHLGDGSLMPEARYFLQGLMLLVPAVPAVALRFRHGRKVLFLVLAALIAHAAGYLAKAHVSGSRRHQYLAACDWAVETIRADYTGPKRDAEPFFTLDDYHPTGRPALVAHINRVNYLLGGRTGAVFCHKGADPVPDYIVDKGWFLVDVPDYIVDEARKVNRSWWLVADYEKLAERKFGKRDFVIYKRTAQKPEGK